MIQSTLGQAILYLAAIVLVVPIAKRLGLGAVLGYLIAGAVLGPHALGLLGGENGHQSALHLAEFGVIMMLLLIGLELQPALLWKLRGPIFGLGGLQVALTTAAAAALSLALAGAVGLAGGMREALVVGFILTLSSTAIVLQTLQERGLNKSSGGETSFAILLFQDIAVIPILAVIPLLALEPAAAPATAHSGGSAWLSLVQVLAAVAAVIAFGRYLVRPIFVAVSKSGLREIFTAVALLLVLGTTALMESVGLSPALGAFLAGVVLANSEYRHQIEADLVPFKGLLLAIFFISVGAGIDFGWVAQHPLQVALGVLLLIGVKGTILLGLARSYKLSRPDAWLLAFALAQGGEFAFVLVKFSSDQGALGTEVGQLLTAVVAMSMALAPLLIGAYAKFLAPRFSRTDGKPERSQDTIDERNPVVLAGFGRFGQTVARLLRANGIQATILDFDADQVELLRKFGQKSFFGDASRADLLESAGIAQARLFIVAVDVQEKATEIVELAKKHWPHVPLMVRCYDRIHAYELIHRGVDHVYIETTGSAANLAVDALKVLGFHPRRAHRAGILFRKNNDHSIRQMAKLYQEAETDEAFFAQARTWLDQLEKMLASDVQELSADSRDGWNSAPRTDAQTSPTPPA